MTNGIEARKGVTTTPVEQPKTTSPRRSDGSDSTSKAHSTDDAAKVKLSSNVKSSEMSSQEAENMSADLANQLSQSNSGMTSAEGRKKAEDLL